ncbi:MULTISPECIES: ABC transporter ATP-binding protein [Actinomycetes]|mgnify:CR=1 FL=1|uniref:ABC transport system ATP-binding/permease protein n=3 Tax=Actinomycetes TaxID=1760 RepID=F8DYW2_CORRG|nr:MULTISPECIES: ABC transporter ATP-binding protein [Actinomycetes]MDU5300406.1 ABC transporter ATP-binding protein [Cutibacterium avidum]AEI09707.1 ABC transport system ATP-binding/permease protein [Corynebacterium resistens DSM 45100]ATH95693.1 ABC transporter ATP-binding protein [Dermabacter jinjuensis]MBN6778028.1 ABC transporter ATP-binding protein [Pseudoclavibacter alba]MCT2043468.1 ABC transporter ATP-binding protein/permease [Pseudoclavibacter alba]
MWKLMIRVVNRAELRTLVGWFAFSAVLQGITLALMIPFLRALFSRSETLGTWLVVVAILGAITVTVDTFAMYRSYRISVYEVCDTLIDRVADHVLQLPLGWFNAKREADVANATSKEINTLSHLASMVIPNLCNAFIVPLVMLVATAFIEWPLAVVMAVSILPFILTWRKMSAATTRANDMEDRTSSAAAGRLIEFARLQPVLRATGAATSWDPVQETLQADSEATLAGLRIKGRPAQGFNLIANVTFAVVLALGLSFVTGARLDPIAYLVIAAVSARMLLPLTKAALYASEVDNAAVALRQMGIILDAAPLAEPDSEQAREPRGTSIEFRGVSFSYESGRPVLDDVSLTAPQGAVTALVGPSGAGKSTILRLTARFWDVDAGSVTIGGVDVREIPTTRIMELTSMVFQDTYLFDTTIRENLRIARPNATNAELEEAARKARLDRVIEALPHGWDTEVGPAGQSLSGGERQRVAIARAFIKDAPILLLDEITSALDGENESAISDVISQLSEGRTVIVVAHRLSTIDSADQVVFLEPLADGAIVAETGTPKELSSRPGRFHDFVAAADASSRWQLRHTSD